MNKIQLLLALLVPATLSLGCGVLERWACNEPSGDCNTPPDPAAGSPNDATLAGTTDEHATISEVEFCEIVGDHETNAVHISTHGSQTDLDFSAWVSDRLVPELRARELPLGRGLTACPHPKDDDGVSFGLITSDWADVDPALGVIRELAIEDDVAVNLSIAVEPVILDCAHPDEACGL